MALAFWLLARDNVLTLAATSAAARPDTKTKMIPATATEARILDGGRIKTCVVRYNCSITYPRFCNNAITLFGPEK